MARLVSTLSRVVLPCLHSLNASPRYTQREQL